MQCHTLTDINSLIICVDQLLNSTRFDLWGSLRNMEPFNMLPFIWVFKGKTYWTLLQVSTTRGYLREYLTESDQYTYSTLQTLLGNLLDMKDKRILIRKIHFFEGKIKYYLTSKYWSTLVNWNSMLLLLMYTAKWNKHKYECQITTLCPFKVRGHGTFKHSVF